VYKYSQKEEIQFNRKR